MSTCNDEPVIADALVSVNAKGFITDWNEPAELLFGWKKSEILGRSLTFTIVPPQHRDAHVAGLARYITTGKATVINQRFATTALHRDGREFPVELTVSAAGKQGDTRFVGDFHGLIRIAPTGPGATSAD